MISDISSPTPQFNNYKYAELTQRLEPAMYDLSPHQIRKGLEILQERCWSQNLNELTTHWQQPNDRPSISSNNLSILHYNIRSFYSNEADLLEIVFSLSPAIVSLNELGTIVPTKTIKQLLFSYQVYSKAGTNAHGGAVLAIDKGLQPIPIDIDDPNVVAVEITTGRQHTVIASIYSPPTEFLPIAAMFSLLNRAKNIIIAGDFSAKHPERDCY